LRSLGARDKSVSVAVKNNADSLRDLEMVGGRHIDPGGGTVSPPGQLEPDWIVHDIAMTVPFSALRLSRL
jgi:hypothetical protein